MRIAIEAQRIFRKEKHGMDFVALETIRELQRREDDNDYYILVAPGDDPCLDQSLNVHVVEVKCPTYPLWEQVALPYAIKRLNVDLLHCTSNTAPLWCPVPLVLTLHDIIYLNSKRPKGMSAYQSLGWHYRQWNVPRIINRCDAVMTVSNKEQERILQYFPQLADKLTVAHNGINSSFQLLPSKKVESVVKHYIDDQDYLLHLGNTDARKNTRGVLQAYAQYHQQSASPRKLILTGLRYDLVQTLLQELHLEQYTSQIICPGYIPGEDLPSLYNGAFAFLFPSFQEGFGIPIIESMACGTPVITSNCSAMPEVAGEKGLFVNPHQPQEIANAILRLEQDSDFYKEQQSYGLEHAHKYSWADTANEWISVYKKVNLKSRKNRKED